MSQRVVSMSEAPGVIRAAVGLVAAQRGGEGGVIAVTGPVGSGKSTLARLLGGCVISTDDYLPDYAVTPEAERDEPRHVDFAGLEGHLRALREGREACVPVWSFETHKREGTRVVKPREGGLVVVEGIHAHHERVRGAVDLLVFVDAPAAVRWARWKHMAATGQRGWDVEYTWHFFQTVAEPTFARLAGHCRGAADVVVENGEFVPVDEDTNRAASCI